MAQSDHRQRLCLLFVAGPSRYALEATSVTEVATPDAEGKAIRGFLQLEDLSIRLGGEPERRPGMAIVLDVSPTLALRVNSILEVADVSGAPPLQLPPAIGEGLRRVIRGALSLKSGLFLELSPDALAKAPRVEAPKPLPVYRLEEPPDRALVFESGQGTYGIPLSVVSQIVRGDEGFCFLPVSHAALGLQPHGGSLWPIYSVPALLGAVGQREELFVLAEVAGLSLGVCASKTLGVHGPFRRADEPGEYLCPSVGAPVLFLDFQRMFS